MDRRIGLLGDVMLGRNVDECQRNRSPAAVWGDVRERLTALDGLIVNLECCLSTRGREWTATYRPFHFRANPGWAVPALEAADVDCCTLANNHVLDYGTVALGDTLDGLDDAGIAHAGAGRTLDAALEPARFCVGSLDVAVISFTDNTPEFAATADDPGTAYVEMDVESPSTRETVETAIGRALDGDPDLLVASLHWGPNMVERPPPAFQTFGRWLVDQGIDVVLGHSAHVFQGVEVYRGNPIIYDAGDFVDDYAVDERLRNDRGFAFVVTVDGAGEPIALDLVPTAIEDCSVSLADRATAGWSRDRMIELSAAFGTTFERGGEGLRCSLTT